MAREGGGVDGVIGECLFRPVPPSRSSEPILLWLERVAGAKARSATQRMEGRYGTPPIRCFLPRLIKTQHVT
jgi:hypothetical protein